MKVGNTLAYYKTAIITALKDFIVQALVKHFHSKAGTSLLSDCGNRSLRATRAGLDSETCLNIRLG
jgi:hypothetical protein